MSFTDEYLKALEEEKKKKKKNTSQNTQVKKTQSTSTKNTSTTSKRDDYTSEFLSALDDDIAPVRTTDSEKKYSGIGGKFGVNSKPTIVSISEDGIPRYASKEKKRTWFDKGVLDDGFQWSDIPKGILGTGTDATTHIGAGLLGIGEKVTDAVAMLGNATYQTTYMQQAMQDEIIYNAMTGKQTEGIVDRYLEEKERSDEATAEFVAKDLYNEEEIAKKIISAPMKKWTGIDSEKDSFFGDKTDALAQSGGQLLGQVAVSAIPGVGQSFAMGMMGASALGSEAESAFKQGATYDEALFSGLVSATAEVVTERIGGISFGGKTLTDKAVDLFSRKATTKLTRALVTSGKLTADGLAEGGEELLSGYMSALGQKLSYMEEKEIEELFNDDDKLESFIGGLVLGETFSGVSTLASDTNVSGMTKDEQSVVDKVYKEAIAEEEKGGKKLTSKEKNKIYDNVVESVQNGSLDIEVIEEALGGESYDAYKKASEDNSALIKERDELNEIKASELTGKQSDRLAELKGMNLDDTTNLDQLGKKWKDDVYNRLSSDRKGQGSLLLESYRERARRGQAFEADLSQYEGKKREAVERAIKSGVLNNTNRSHELVNVLSQIEADKGIIFDYTDNKKLKESGFAIGGKTINGFVKDGAVTLNMQSSKAWESTVGHEITHVLEGTKVYGELQSALFEYAKSKGEFDTRKADIMKLYEKVENADIDGELTAELISDYLFNDKSFINHLTGNRTVFQKVWDEVKYLYKVATGKEKASIEKVMKEFDQAWKEMGKANVKSEGTKYSVGDKNIKDESTGYGYGETYFTMSYNQDGKTVATLEYGEYEGTPNVKMVKVDPEYRRQGIATKLLQELQKKYPDTEIDFGMTTPDGTKLLESITYDVTDDTVVAKQNEYKALQAELDELQGKLDVLYDTENLTEAQEEELEKLGDRWTEVYDAIRKLEPELRGKNATKTFVKYSVSEEGDYGYHAGDLGKSEGYWNMVSSSRGTGHFGTGTYFVGDEAEINGATYGNRPHEKVDFSKYKLYKPFLESEGFELHESLKYINNNISLYPVASMSFDEMYDVCKRAEDAEWTLYRDDATEAEKSNAQKTLDGLKARFESIGYDPDSWSADSLKEKLRDIRNDYRKTMLSLSSLFSHKKSTGFLSYEETENKINSILQNVYEETSKIEDAYNAIFEDSASTRFMKAMGYEGIDVRGFKGLDNVSYGSVIYDLKGEDLARKKEIGTAKYSVSEDSEGNELSLAVQKRFANSKAVDENGNLKVLYHGTAAGEFYTFDKSKGSVEGDFGSGFYFTDNESDVEANYEDGGPDFDNKISRRAEQIEQEEDIDYSEAEARAREELYKGGFKHSVYLNIENPAVVGETTLFDYESYAEEYDRDDYDSDEDYEGDVEQLIADDIDQIIWDIEQNVDIYSTDGIADVLWNAVNEGGIGIEQLKAQINELYLEDNNGNLVGNEVTRQIIESLGYDGIIDNTVSSKFNMNLDEGTTHYIVFKPNQIKSIDNQNPTDNPDIRYSISEKTLDNSQNLTYNDMRGEAYVRTDEFRNLQAESQRMSDEDTKLYHSGSKQIDDEVRGRLSRTFGLEIRAANSKRIYSVRTLLNPKTNNNVNIYEGVDGSLFHDCFEISRKYLRNGELVDLHEVKTTEDGIGYDDCENYLSEDGLSGFSITPDGDLISVFNLNAEKGFLKTIAPIVKEKAKTLDCYASPNQNLMAMYEKIFGFKTASLMDYNMKYDHDNIAENHGMPNIAFMVNSESDVKTKQFTKDEYDEAVSYRNSFVLSDDFAPVKNSLSNNGEQPSTKGTPLRDLYLEQDIAPIREDVAKNATATSEAPIDAVKETTEENSVAENVAPVVEAEVNSEPITPKSTRIADGTRSEELLVESLVNYPMQTVEQKVAEKIRSVEAELADKRDLRREAENDYNNKIANLQKQYAAKKDKTTITAYNLLNSISRLEGLKARADSDYAKRISDLEARLEKMKEPTYTRAMQKQAKMQEHAKFAENLLGDTSTWVDKKLGLQYAVNTERRNLRDIVRDENGNVDIKKADAINDALNGQYNRDEAEKQRELAKIRKKYADLKITRAEDTYAQMLGEFRHNPKTTLTQEAIDKYYEENKNKIDVAKVEKVIEYARKDYDDLIVRLNEVLREQGMKEIPYRKGYFPHFTEPKQNFFQKLINWKVQDNEIPTSIAGLTEDFKPTKSWQSFDKTRYSDETDYSFTKGFDKYSEGALDWIHHIETLQKRRAVENHIRFTHSDEGIQARIKEVYADENMDADEAQAQIDHILTEAENPLNNFVQDFMTHTNILANKKNSLDRTAEQMTNRKIYNVMQNVQNRTSANMVLANIRSALTNFIPITQSWAQVSPLRSLQATKDVIANAIKDDGMVDKSTFLTNRLREADKLYQSNWDKVLDKAGIMFEVIDNISSQVIWRSKYNQNIANHMTEEQAIANADQFAENVMAGRSKGNEPTIFNAKNPLVKAFTMFQLEVNNQYGYLFKDVPNDLKAETNHWKFNMAKGLTTAFVGAYVYNALLSKVTGSDAALDPIGIIEELLRDLGLFDDDEEKEPDEVITNLADNVIEELPFVGGIFGGGRIPISSAMPYGGEYGGGLSGAVKDVTEGNWKNIGKEMMKPLLNVGLPVGGGQLKKTVQGLGMFNTDEEHPVMGSYTDSGKLRFPVEDTPLNRIQAGLFGQYANENAREYFDNGYDALNKKQIQEYQDVDLPIGDYWKYREGVKGLKTNGEKADFINSLDIADWQKNILMNNILDRKEDVDMTNYDDYADYEEFDWSQKNPEKYDFFKTNGISYSDYANADEDGKDAYNWAYNNTEKFVLSKAITDDVITYRSYTDALFDIKADKDASGKTISGSAKAKKRNYIFNLDGLDYGQKAILYRSLYDSKDDKAEFDEDIVYYINSRNDLTDEEKVTIYTELGFTVKDGYVYW